ncbi:sarcosine oxidase subunit delta family protein [Oleomonas cavernae]|uniref:Sarcosine oxidase subunit delta family protein n=1 Tax=Oleomonas cavernae TaxID=2320859 RepID=A0A418WG26_9PROT|nr:sarcosine oxidase subunit delta [Oleomonas cavernae]RJF88958.1 sarcosine oxidase subunit delta family protein [Oleomonas cavernae]
MLLIRCPYCGERPETEFRYGGEAHIARPADPSALDDEAWADFLYKRTNPRGLHVERWRHIHGCAQFFNAVRHTVSDAFVVIYKKDDPRPDLSQLIPGGGK